MALKEDLDRLMRKKPGRVVAIHEDDAREIVRDAIAPLTARISELEAALQQVTAERDEARDLAYELKLATAGGEDVPGSANLVTVDDVRRWCAEDARLIATATSELARLRAEGEAKDRALKLCLAELDWQVSAAEHCGDPDRECPMQDISKPSGEHMQARDAARTALARAATAREG